MWVYNTASTIRSGTKADKDAKVLKTKVTLNWMGAFKILAVGSSPAEATPDGRPLAAKLLCLDLHKDTPSADAPCRVSVVRCKPRANP